MVASRCFQIAAIHHAAHSAPQNSIAATTTTSSPLVVQLVESLTIERDQLQHSLKLMDTQLLATQRELGAARQLAVQRAQQLAEVTLGEEEW